MALRAGYYGLKNSVKRSLEKLASDMSGAKIIKTIGNGLTLSDQGALAANIDSDTMEFKDHKLAAKLPTLPPAFEMDLLSGNDTYNPTASTADIDLSEVIDDYDMLYVICGWLTGTGGCVTAWINVDILKQLTGTTTAGNHWLIGVNPHADQWLRIGYDDGVLKQFGSQTVGIINVYGIKF